MYIEHLVLEVECAKFYSTIIAATLMKCVLSYPQAAL